VVDICFRYSTLLLVTKEFVGRPSRNGETAAALPALAFFEKADEKAHSDKIRKTISVHFGHDMGAVNFHCPGTYGEVRSDDLIGMSSN
jgi:hypothetical protein